MTGARDSRVSSRKAAARAVASSKCAARETGGAQPTGRDLEFRSFLRLVETGVGRGRRRVFWNVTDRANTLELSIVAESETGNSRLEIRVDSETRMAPVGARETGGVDGNATSSRVVSWCVVSRVSRRAQRNPNGLSTES